MTYKIVRFFKDVDKHSKDTGVKGLTLEEAQEHCKRDDTHGSDWFDGYTEE